jgi:hypothetical protein
MIATGIATGHRWLSLRGVNDVEPTVGLGHLRPRHVVPDGIQFTSLLTSFPQARTPDADYWRSDEVLHSAAPDSLVSSLEMRGSPAKWRSSEAGPGGSPMYDFATHPNVAVARGARRAGGQYR